MKKIKNALRILKLIVICVFIGLSVGFFGGLPVPQSSRKHEREQVKIEMVEKLNTISEIEIDERENK